MTGKEKEELNKVAQYLYLGTLSTVAAGVTLITLNNIIAAIIFGLAGSLFYKGYETKKFKIYNGEYK
jgi:hypothetical protein